MYKARIQHLKEVNDYYLRMINDHKMNGMWIKVLRNNKVILSLEEEMIGYSKDELFDNKGEE